MNQMQPTLCTVEKWNQHSILQTSKVCPFYSGNMISYLRIELHVFSHSKVTEWKMEGTEKSIYWTLWPNFDVPCSTGTLVQTYNKCLWSDNKLSLAIIHNKRGRGSGSSDYLKCLIYTDVPYFNQIRNRLSGVFFNALIWVIF